MKIAIVIKDYTLERGGLERYGVQLSRFLAREGCDVHLLANRCTVELEESITWHPISMWKKPAWLKVISFARSIRRYLQTHSFDIVYSLSLTYPTDAFRIGDLLFCHWWIVRFPNPILRLGYSLIRHVYWANTYLEKQIMAEDSPTVIIANSHLGREQAQSYYGVRSERLHVIHNGVDLERFNAKKSRARRDEIRSQWNIPSAASLLLFVANDWQRKGLITVLQAMGEMKRVNNPPHLLVAGKGKPSKYQTCIRDCSLQNRVHFAGRASNIEACYGAADLFVFPTLYDPFANVCLEAMACGLPVITTRENGFSELIEPGRNGFILKDCADFRQLARWLELGENPAFWKTMGLRAEETAQDHSYQRTAKETLAVFEEIHRRKIQSNL